ncbi:uncharacterized protein RHO25_005662 [Cercospora beticola]|uniref:Nephrocystin 3-like N-terminal domain-containing protein n=1 Tax=Cercospora beticola TaxID=122368 RepID=A0ABZ0NNC2_CERBT|nr:hypothetical protein RHO25_005662 [Cercospora beticola]
MARTYTGRFSQNENAIQANHIENSVFIFGGQAEAHGEVRSAEDQQETDEEGEYDFETETREKREERIFWSNHYKTWLHNAGFLYIEGESGTGKSTLMLDLVRKALRKSQAHNLSFFFMRGVGWESSLLAMLHALLHQILAADDRTMVQFSKRSDFRKRCEQDGSPGHSTGSWKWTEVELQSLLRTSALSTTAQCPITILIDALDECKPEERQAVWTFLKSVVRSSPKISLCIASRPTGNVDRKLVRYIDLKTQTSRDIQAQLNVQLGNFEEGIRSTLVIELLQKCQGSFRWAALAADELLRIQHDFGDVCLTARALLEELARLPSGLTALYGTLLKRLSVLDARLLLAVFSWVSSAFRPLTCGELQAGLALRPDVAGLPKYEFLRDTQHFPIEMEQWLEKVKRLSLGLLALHKTPHDPLFKVYLEAVIQVQCIQRDSDLQPRLVDVSPSDLRTRVCARLPSPGRTSDTAVESIFQHQDHRLAVFPFGYRSCSASNSVDGIRTAEALYFHKTPVGGL